MKKLINFNDFAQFLTGVNNREEQINILKDSLIDIKSCEEIKECELLSMFDKKCEFSQRLLKFNGFYEVLINNKWTCDIVNKFNAR